MRPKKAKFVDDHDSGVADMGRRAFITLVGGGTGLIAAVGLLGSVASIVGVSLKDVLEERESSEKAERLTILRDLFGFAGEGAALVPAADHPSGPPANHLWYPVDSAAAVAYKRALYPEVPLEQVNRIALDANPLHSLVMFGSQVSNAELRCIFGNPWTERDPHFSIVPGKLGSGWRANLRWNLYCCESMREMKPIQYLEPGLTELWPEDERVILDAKNRSQYGATRSPMSIPDVGKVDSLVEDFLLVTVLPRNYDTSGQKIISFAGLYGPGMAAAELLFTAPLSDLRLVREETQGEPFYQALFRVSANTNDKNETVPKSLHLVKAVPLYLTARKGGDAVLSAV